MSLLAPVSSAPPVPPAVLSAQSLQAEVVRIARLVPFEAGVDTHTHVLRHMTYDNLFVKRQEMT